VNLQVAKGKRISPDDIFNPLHPEIKEEKANRARENAISDHDDILNTFKDELLNDKYLNENIKKELMKKRLLLKKLSFFIFNIE
jgi:hypothetical protein